METKLRRPRKACSTSRALPLAVVLFLTTGEASAIGLPCDAGTYNSASGGYQPNCTPASVGNYVPTTGATAQTPCPIGQYQGFTGQSACIPAPPGTYVITTGAATATLCTPGRFQDEYGASNCKSVAAGYYSTVAGASSPGLPCPGGTFQPATGQSACIQSNRNYYAGPLGAQAQLPCPAGTYSVTGAASCTSQHAELKITFNYANYTTVAGRDLAVTVMMTNDGPDAALDAYVSIPYTFPMQVVWRSPECQLQADGILCPYPALANGVMVTPKVVFRLNQPGAASSFITAMSYATPSSSPGNVFTSLYVPMNAGPAPSQKQRYRLFNPFTKEHHYTTDANEYAVLGALGTWVPEGPAGKLFDNPGAYNGFALTPYYRLYNTATAMHHWTSDANEYYTLTLFPQYSGEGVDGWILPTSAPGSIPLYRLLYPYNVPVAGLHHWTTDLAEYNALIAQYGWAGEGIAGYVLP